MRITPLSLLLLAVPLAAQTINVNQIRGGPTPGYVMTTVAGSPNTAQWQPGGGLVPVWPNIYYSAIAPGNSFTYASVFIGGVGFTVNVPSGCAGTFGNATTLATGSTPLVFKDITTSTTLCTLTFGTGSGTAVVTGSGGTLSSGDLISLTVATADATLAGVTAELAGTIGSGGEGGSSGFPITIGATAIAASSTTTAITGLSVNGVMLTTGGSSSTFLNGAGSYSTPTTSVTSVGLTLPAIFTVTGSPVTSSGTLAATLATQAANLFFAGPSSGSAAAPTFRAIVAADLPLGTNSTPGAVQCDNVTTTCTAGVIVASGTGIPYPAGTGIAVVAGGTAWGTTIDASHLIPSNLLPQATSSVLGAASCDGTTTTCAAGVITAHFAGVSNVSVTVSAGSLGSGCSGSTNVTMTGLTTGQIVEAGYSGDPTSLTGWGLSGGMAFYIWPSASNTATWKICNLTGSTLSYSAITFTVGAH